MNIEKLIYNINVIETRNIDEEKVISIKQIDYNSKFANKGSLFVCIKGYKVDGHDFAMQAYEKGAVALVVERFIEDIPLPQYLVENTRLALACIGANYYDEPSKKLKVMGITATNGKTTTSFMVDKILSDNHFKTGLIGTVAVKYGDFVEPAILTTPESLDLQKHCYNMVNEGVTHLCMEVSSSALELNRSAFIDYDIVSLHNIAREHIDLHGSFENYYKFKSSLITTAKPNQFVVLNEDDPYSIGLKDKTEGKVISYGIEKETGTCSCMNLDLSTGKGVFDFCIHEAIVLEDKIIAPQSFRIELGTGGYHSVHNAMVAIIAGLLMDVSIESIQKSMATFTGVERRFEMIYDDTFKIIDDHFANAGNINVTLKTLEKMDYNNFIMVYALRGSRGVTVISEVAEEIVKWKEKLNLEKVIVSLSIGDVTWKDEVTDDEIEAFRKILDEGQIDIEWHDDLREAVEKGLKEVTDDDVLLLAGCQGMDKGGRMALEKIAEENPQIDRQALLAIVDKRDSGF